MSADTGTTRDAEFADGAPASNDPQDWAAWGREAVAERRWDEALARFDLCIARFGVRPHWLTQKANALRRLDRLDEAEAIYGALAQDHPQLSSGLDGLAWTAARRGDNARALELFTRCIAAYPDKSVHTWTRQRAQLLMRLGRLDEAQNIFDGLIKDDPTDIAAHAGYVRAAIESGRAAGDHDAR
ncbi:MAG TPA: tetratricopeptide repeat protein, partial [Rhizomicrobium sp.]|nr:tetratricopeptide repeat protein [Rhizomicrobium sp.]